MKRFIKDLKGDTFVYLFAFVGLLLTVFPTKLAKAAPVMIGLMLIIYSVTSIIIYVRNGNEDINPGKSFVYLILGAAITHQKSNAIGAIGSMWAMISLIEAAEEINDWLRSKEFSLFHTMSIIISTFLALMLLFDPFKHFEMHMRVLGIEMILSIFERRHKTE